MNTNAELLYIFIGETIKSVADTNRGNWHDSDGVIVTFESGRQLELIADCGQELGILLTSEVTPHNR